MGVLEMKPCMATLVGGAQIRMALQVARQTPGYGLVHSRGLLVGQLWPVA